MTALEISLADAIVADLNDQLDVEGTEFVAERRWLVEYSPDELIKTRVTVVPRGFETSLASRATENELVLIDIGINRKVDTAKLDECDTVANLAFAVRDFLKSKSYLNQRYRRIVTTSPQFYNPLILREYSVFQALMTITFKTVR
jgi:hypothetical protein